MVTDYTAARPIEELKVVIALRYAVTCVAVRPFPMEYAPTRPDTYLATPFGVLVAVPSSVNLPAITVTVQSAG